MDRINALRKVVSHNISRTDATMGYERVTQAIIALADCICNTDDEIGWYLGEFEDITLDDLIIGAYWHYTEWHGGQYSKGYAALSSLGKVYSPNMDTPDPDNYAYQLLEIMAADDRDSDFMRDNQ